MTRTAPVVTAVEVLSAAGLGVDPVRRAIADGARVVGPAEIAPDLLLHAGSRVERMDRLSRLAIAVGIAAVHKARLAVDSTGSIAPTAVVFASAYASLLVNERFWQKVVTRGPRFADPKRFPYTSPNIAGGEISIALGLKGPNVSLTSGWHVGLAALATAVDLVALGRARAALVVAADALGPLLAGGARAEGLIEGEPAEAAAAIVVESEAHAAGRGVRPLARVRAAAESFGEGSLGALLLASGPVAAAIGTAQMPAVQGEEVAALVAAPGTPAVRALSRGLGECFGAAGLVGAALAAADPAPGGVVVTALCPYGGRATVTFDPTDR